MKNFIGTENQIKLKNTLVAVFTWALCPLWIPLVCLLFILSTTADILENIVLDGSNDIIHKVSEWIARKIY